MNSTLNTPYRIENIAPILSIRNMKESLRFYCDILGFASAEWGDEIFTSISRNNSSIYLCKDGQGNVGTWVWIGFDGDINKLHQELTLKGIKIKLPPTNFYWAYEMQVEDPDGHVLRLGTDPDPDQPTHASF